MLIKKDKGFILKIPLVLIWATANGNRQGCPYSAIISFTTLTTSSVFGLLK
jgi:hypothetical protein